MASDLHLENAAIFLMSLSAEESASIMKHLDPKQVQKIGIAMASLGVVEKARADEVLSNFIAQSEMQTSLGMDADNYIRQVLVDALGEDKASGVIDRILFGAKNKGLETLKWMEPRAIADIIRYEHPQIQTIILSYLDPDQAAEVLAYFDEVVRLDLMMRISSLDSVQPEALNELNDIMEESFHGKTQGQSKSMGGIRNAADIMNFLDSNIEEKLLSDIKEKNEDLGQSIQDLMFVFENLLDVDDRSIQTILREVSTDTLILALKGAIESIKEKIFKNMSKRAAELLKDDLEAKGPVKLSEVEAAQKEILATARRLAESGEITLGGKGEEMI